MNERARPQVVDRPNDLFVMGQSLVSPPLRSSAFTGTRIFVIYGDREQDVRTGANEKAVGGQNDWGPSHNARRDWMDHR
ncbi:MAG: hypothetical protein AB7G47_03510 [Mycolicibacterium sp.]|uniref:hypothetical protein n=1 Tax=Mycolicibacterium sp. TaxID=2320850 RepID=UPI003D12E95C